jgi:hypothetical protein
MTRADSLLDCSRPSVIAFWCSLGVGFGLLVLAAIPGRNVQSLLRVGASNPMLERMQRDIPGLVPTDPTGHDGQLYYMVARDPLGRNHTAEAITSFDNNGARYRYRRILYPVVAGGFGLFDGPSTLVGMVAVNVISLGLIAVAVADLAYQLRVAPGLVLLANFNAGSVISLLLLTADAPAMALGLAAIGLAHRNRGAMSIAACALAALTKEVYVLVGLSLALWHWRHGRTRTARGFGVIPLLPLLAWTSLVQFFIPAGGNPGGNVGVPLVGVADAISVWINAERNRLELALAVIGLLTIVLAAIVSWSKRLPYMRLLMAPWIAVAAVSTLQVWGKPNNVVRAFSIVWPLAILSAGALVTARTGSATEGRLGVRA